VQPWHHYGNIGQSYHLHMRKGSLALLLPQLNDVQSRNTNMVPSHAVATFLFLVIGGLICARGWERVLVLVPKPKVPGG
jgi:hypothetical protein